MRTTKEDISNQVDGKIICFDEDQPDLDYLCIFYDQSTNELCAGGCFNAGISKDYAIDYDHDFSIDENLQALYDYILEMNML